VSDAGSGFFSMLSFSYATHHSISVPWLCVTALKMSSRLDYITTILVFHWGTLRKEISFTLHATNSWQLEEEEAVVVVVVVVVF
jgi:hypothetical protein